MTWRSGVHLVLANTLFGVAFAALATEFVVLFNRTALDGLTPTTVSFWLFLLFFALVCTRLFQQYTHFFRRFPSRTLGEHYVDVLEAACAIGAVLTITWPAAMFLFMIAGYFVDAYKCSHTLRRRHGQLKAQDAEQLRRWRRHDLGWYVPVLSVCLLVYVLSEALVAAAIVLFGFITVRTLLGLREQYK